MIEYVVRIPRRFAEDREFRDLSNGTGYWLKRVFVAIINDEELMDLKSDAEYYANSPLDTWTWPADMRGMRDSARRTLKAIERGSVRITS